MVAQIVTGNGLINLYHRSITFYIYNNMKRKVGEVFTYNGKTYKVIKGFECEQCDIRGCCFAAASIVGSCLHNYRSDKTDVVFKEINNMEIKNNQLTIDIPEGMKIDLENSDLAKGIVKFKQSTITYEYVEDALKLCMHGKDIIVNESNVSKLVNLSKLMNIARYYNRDWKPNWSDISQRKYCIIYNKSDDAYSVDYNTGYTYNNIYFSTKEDAISVIFNPKFKHILDAIYKD